jgi:hypothetical protein
MLVETGWLERDRAGTTYGAGRQLPVAFPAGRRRPAGKDGHLLPDLNLS